MLFRLVSLGTCSSFCIGCFDSISQQVLGHKMIASVLAYNLLDADATARTLNKDSSNSASASSGSSRSSSATSARATVPGPFYVSPSLAAAYSGGASHFLSLATYGDLKKALLHGSDALKGFLVMEDVAGKPGLIATQVGASVVLKLPIPRDEPPAKTYLVMKCLIW
jgi:hypothetical protein